MENKLQTATVSELRSVLANQYAKQITNFFRGDDSRSMKFLSSVVAAVQRTPKLLECDQTSLINSFVMMAQLELMPSDVSGEAYVLPYKGRAQFQLGYQGLVTLFYRAGVKSIVAEVVYKNDGFRYVNGVIEHSPDIFSEDRGEAIGAYVIIETPNGGKVSKVMNKNQIVGIGKKFSKSFNTDFTPWKESNDPELWMWKKTVLKQAAKLVPKNEKIFQAIEEDNKDSVISDRSEEIERFRKAADESKQIKIGSFQKPIVLVGCTECGSIEPCDCIPVVKQ